MFSLTKQVIYIQLDVKEDNDDEKQEVDEEGDKDNGERRRRKRKDIERKWMRDVATRILDAVVDKDNTQMYYVNQQMMGDDRYTFKVVIACMQWAGNCTSPQPPHCPLVPACPEVGHIYDVTTALCPVFYGCPCDDSPSCVLMDVCGVVVGLLAGQTFTDFTLHRRVQLVCTVCLSVESSCVLPLVICAWTSAQWGMVKYSH